MHDLTRFQRDCLYVIAGLDSPKGVTIKAKLDDYYPDAINYGQLYPNLDTLVEKGLVEKGEIDKRTNFYRVTDRGRRKLQARREWEDQYLSEVPVEA